MKPGVDKKSHDELDRLTSDWYLDLFVQGWSSSVGSPVSSSSLQSLSLLRPKALASSRTDLPSQSFGSPLWRPTSEENPTYGAMALVIGTASVTGFAMLIAVPFSLGAAIFVGEFATGKTREVLKVLVELLAAIPSVVWGFIGLSIMNPFIIDTFNVPVGLNVLNAGTILGLMAAPIMTTIAEDALKAVPDGYREAAEAMGATRWQVIYKVVIPSAKNGLLAAVLLGVGRGFGETWRFSWPVVTRSIYRAARSTLYEP